MSVFGRIRESLTRTKQQIVDRFDEIVRRADEPERRSRPVDVDTIDALEELLISADIGVAATDRIISAVKARSRSGESLRDLVKQEIRAVFDSVDQPITVASRSAGHADRRRERNREDDHGREAREFAETTRCISRSSAQRTRFVPQPSSSSKSGRTGPASTWCVRARAPIRRPSCSMRLAPPKPGIATLCSLTPPAGCTLGLT